MRNPYRRRSLASFLIWTVALVAMAAAASWQFQWWPTTEVDLEGISLRLGGGTFGDEPSSGVRSASHEQSAAKSTVASEPDIFADQSEPDPPDLSRDIPPFEAPEPPDFSDFPSPPKLLPANPDAKPVPPPSRLVQTVEGDLPMPVFPPEPINEPPNSTAIQLLAEEETMETRGEDPSEWPEEIEEAADQEWPEEMEEVADQLEQIDEWIASSDPKQELSAHKELSTLYWEHPEWREFLRSRIEKTAKSIYFAKQPHYMTPYTVQPGDQLVKIGKLYKVPWEYLARLNDVEPRKIRAGQKLKVIKGPFAAVVDLHRFELTIQHHGFFVKRYKIGIGKDGTTPIGEFTVKNKLVNPTYYGPNGLVIDADDPKNPLGEYWIDIGDSYGIHGTIEPDSIGKAKSRGCLRLLNDEAAEVYGFLGEGAKVIIRR